MRISDWSSDVCSSDLRQLTAILGSRRGAAHAGLLALPRIDPNGRRIDWYTALPGPVRPVADLPDDEQLRLRAEAERLTSDIEGLGAALVQAGGTGELVGRMLTLAVRTPGPEHMHAVGDQPRSDEGRVGKECVSTRRYRGSACH